MNLALSQITPKDVVRNFEVEGLFGRFNYSIPCTGLAGANQGLVILTAPNGYGKSTILTLLNDIIQGAHLKIAKVKFKKITIITSNEISLVIEKVEDHENAEKVSIIDSMTMQFSLIDNETGINIDKPWLCDLSLMVDEVDEDQYTGRFDITKVERDFPYLRRVGINEWRDIRNGRVLSRSEIYRIREQSQASTPNSANQLPEPEWLSNVRSRLSVLYISANRLRFEGEQRAYRARRVSDAVSNWAERVREQIRDVIRNYADKGRRLEQTFASRVIAALDANEEVTQKMVEDLIEEVRLKESKYQTLGLIGEGKTVGLQQLISSKAALNVLRCYLKDAKEKFIEIEHVADRLELFLETVNSMLQFKQLRLSSESGFEIFSDSGVPIPAGGLSSGEQHLIVLLGELIFGSSGVNLILLDEPEISFHPAWQDNFPKVLNRIIDINGCLIIMATHSPTMIQGEDDSIIELSLQVETK